MGPVPLKPAAAAARAAASAAAAAAVPSVPSAASSDASAGSPPASPPRAASPAPAPKAPKAKKAKKAKAAAAPESDAPAPEAAKASKAAKAPIAAEIDADNQPRIRNLPKPGFVRGAGRNGGGKAPIFSLDDEPYESLQTRYDAAVAGAQPSKAKLTEAYDKFMMEYGVAHVTGCPMVWKDTNGIVTHLCGGFSECLLACHTPSGNQCDLHEKSTEGLRTTLHAHWQRLKYFKDHKLASVAKLTPDYAALGAFVYNPAVLEAFLARKPKAPKAAKGPQAPQADQ